MCDCKNNGTCDRVTGECHCPPGYYGHLCEHGEKTQDLFHRILYPDYFSQFCNDSKLYFYQKHALLVSMAIAASFCVTARPMHLVTLKRAAASVLLVTKDSAVIEVQRSSCIMLIADKLYIYSVFFFFGHFFPI